MDTVLASYEVAQAVNEVPEDWPERAAFWALADPGVISHFHAKGSSHRPPTTFRLLWSDADLYLRFDVADQHLLCLNTARQSSVCKDSCVEFFVQPASAGYINFEVSANGTILAQHVIDPARTPGGFVDYRPLTDAELDLVEIHSSVHGVVDPERHGPINWWVAVRIPFAVLRPAGGEVPMPGSRWRANFYKIATGSSMPHFGSWSCVGEQLNFHQPDKFGDLRFTA